MRAILISKSDDKMKHGGRKDDTVEQLTVRMDGYEKSTKPVIDFYDKRGIVSYIDASQETAAVFEKVKEALSKLK